MLKIAPHTSPELRYSRQYSPRLRLLSPSRTHIAKTRLSTQPKKESRLFYNLPLFQARRDRIEFRPVEINDDVSPILVSRLVAYAGCEEVVPLNADQRLHKSRSGYFTVPETGDRLKGKGGFGIAPYGKKTFELTPPCPELTRAELTELHIKLNADFKIEHVEGKPRALYSLTAGGADNEYLFGKMLAAYEIAMPPVLRGHFYLRGLQEPEKDLYGNPTGAVFHRHTAGMTTFNENFPFLAIDFQESQQIYDDRSRSFLDGSEKNMEEAIHVLSEWTGRMGMLRRRAIFEGGIMRHAGHFDNFLWLEALRKAYLHDFDSCLSAASLPEEMRAPYLVRDIASDIMRICKMTIKQLYISPLVKVLQESFLPVETYLKAFLGEEFVAKKHGAFCNIFAQSLVRGLLRPDLNLEYFRNRWVFLNGQSDSDPHDIEIARYVLDIGMDALWAPAMQLAFYTARTSRYATEKDFKITAIDDEEFTKRLPWGLNRYLIAKRRKFDEGRQLIEQLRQPGGKIITPD